MSALWPLILPVLILVPGLNAFPYPPEGRFSDLVISHYPNLLYLRQAILENGIFPLWSPTILSGYPFAADPLSGLWYPPGWLALFMPDPAGFNLLIAIHLIFGGIGAYYFLRRGEGLTHTAALFGGMAFGMTPKLFAHYGAGHLTLIYAMVWTPWLLFSVARSRVQEKQGGNGHVDLLPGIILGIIFLADPRWAVYAGILWWIYDISYSRLTWRGNTPLGSFLHSLRRLVPQTLLAALLASPLWLPLLEYTQLSTRASLNPEDVMDQSLPPLRMLGLFFPDFGGFHEWVIYPGAIILVLAVVGLLCSRGNRYSYYYWGTVGTAALILSMGEYVPGMSALAALPGFDLLRVPPRALLVVGFALVVMAANSLDRLLYEPGRMETKRSRVVAMAIGVFPLTIFLGIWIGIGYKSAEFFWGAIFFMASAVWIWGVLRLNNGSTIRGSKIGSILVAAVFILCLVDRGVMDSSLFTSRTSESVRGEQSTVADYLSEQPGQWRVYSPSYSVPQQTALIFDLELADGVDPLHLRSYTEYMERATGIPVQGYSVTIPPFEDGDPEQANSHYRPDPHLLGRLNVGYVVSEYDLHVDGLILKEQVGQTRIYQNLWALPRAWVQPEDPSSGEDIISPASVQELTPNRVVANAIGPGLLVLSEIVYPGWGVWVDGVENDLEVFDGLLRGVVIPPGEHEIIFRYRPVSVYIGLSLALVGLLIVVVWKYKSNPSRKP